MSLSVPMSGLELNSVAVIEEGSITLPMQSQRLFYTFQQPFALLFIFYAKRFFRAAEKSSFGCQSRLAYSTHTLAHIFSSMAELSNKPF